MLISGLRAWQRSVQTAALSSTISSVLNKPRVFDYYYFSCANLGACCLGLLVLRQPKFFVVLVSSYRPISLINSDSKLLSSIYVDHFQTFASKLFPDTQSGFIRGRSIKSLVATKRRRHPLNTAPLPNIEWKESRIDE